jgi:hypothetical protein
MSVQNKTQWDTPGHHLVESQAAAPSRALVCSGVSAAANITLKLKYVWRHDGRCNMEIYGNTSFG